MNKPINNDHHEDNNDNHFFDVQALRRDELRNKKL